jgi:hypothetical protein
MEPCYIVTLTRDERTIHIVVRADDFDYLIRIDRGNNPKMKYGKGRMWDVKNVTVKDTQEVRHA